MLWVDVLIVALGFSAVASALVYGRVVDDTGGDPLLVATNLAYPVADAAAARPDRRPARRVRPARWRALVVRDRRLRPARRRRHDLPLRRRERQLRGRRRARRRVAGRRWCSSAQRPGSAPGRLDGSVLRDRGFLPVPLAAGLCATGLLLLDHYHRLDPFAVWAAGGCVLAVVVRLGGTFRDNGRMLRASRREAATDALTGLGNRRALIAELESRLAERRARAGRARAVRPRRLQGLQRRASATRPATCCSSGSAPASPRSASAGRAFRMGGDEFCVLFPANARADLVGRARQALSEEGEGFTVTASAGTVALPGEARTVSDALSIADRRMYAHKRGGRTSASNQAKDVLLRARAGAQPAPRRRTAARSPSWPSAPRSASASSPTSCARSARAPSCTTSASSRSPTRSSPSPGRSTRPSGRSCAATRSSASASSPPRRRSLDVAPLVRSSHERWDGAGYPDGLAGEEIPLGARVIGVCDAWDAMVTDRPYRRALPRRRARRARALLRDPVRSGGRRGVPRVLAQRAAASCRRLAWPRRSSARDRRRRASIEATARRRLA